MTKQPNYKIDIHWIAGQPLAILKKRMFGLIWVKQAEEWQLSNSDFDTVGYWMDKYNIPAKDVKEVEMIM
jgi:hypothetical protein